MMQANDPAYLREVASRDQAHACMDGLPESLIQAIDARATRLEEDGDQVDRWVGALAHLALGDRQLRIIERAIADGDDA